MYIHVTFWANPFIYFIMKITSEGFLSEQDSLYSSKCLYLQYYFSFINLHSMFDTYQESENSAWIAWMGRPKAS